MDQGCQLYLRFNADMLPDEAELERLARRVEPAALLVTGAAGETVRGFIEAARRQTLAVLIENDARLAKAFDAHGLHLRADSQALAEARRALGGEKSIGASCILSRHQAMTMAEEGADYVAFGEFGLPDAPGSVETAEMIQWWHDLFEIPCVAWARESYEEADLRDVIHAGADYLALDAGGRTGSAMLEWFERIAALARSETGSARSQ